MLSYLALLRSAYCARLGLRLGRRGQYINGLSWAFADRRRIRQRACVRSADLRFGDSDVDSARPSFRRVRDRALVANGWAIIARGVGQCLAMRGGVRCGSSHQRRDVVCRNSRRRCGWKRHHVEHAIHKSVSGCPTGGVACSCNGHNHGSDLHWFHFCPRRLVGIVARDHRLASGGCCCARFCIPYEDRCYRRAPHKMSALRGCTSDHGRRILSVLPRTSGRLSRNGGPRRLGPPYKSSCRHRAPP